MTVMVSALVPTSMALWGVIIESAGEHLQIFPLAIGLALVGSSLLVYRWKSLHAFFGDNQ